MAFTLCARTLPAVSSAIRKHGFLQRLQQTGSYPFQFGEAKARPLLPRRADISREWEAGLDPSQRNKKTGTSSDLLDEIRQRFLSFKRDKYLKDLDKFQALAKAQAPKVMVIGCVDSRACPSTVLGFEPGEAFMVRNVANLVPPIQNGPTETNSALEFAVNTLQVERIIVMGHSNCGGIEALMNLQLQEHQEQDSSKFVEKWVMNAEAVKLRTRANAWGLSFEQQCRYCEKESIRESVMNLLTYPWIRERVKRRVLGIYGCYYDLSDCSIEKWRLCSDNNTDTFSISDTEFWS
ncbi:PREDICTED: beta carbonic anhydrase 6, mitochondrial [Tarenaya hassleriana]|uniref:beta carbonic anhydrase 6, mitochondrial n=1 Tax=Tarenaya hassleriana TaxID=28532 RepID=UPI00053C440C|nr:PREDICTED: beta carbonic anhydrase 6, mitochondrial [Tarenaya hassleriana]